MSNILSQLSGPYSKKVEELMKMTRDHARKKPADDPAFSDCLNEKDMLNHFDYDPAGYKHRLKVTVAEASRAKEILRGIGTPQEIENNFAFGNSMIFRGGYNTIDTNHGMTLAAAIWILDQLSLQGDLEEIYQFLPDISESVPQCVYVVHPEYDFDLIASLVQLLCSRNDETYEQGHFHKSTFYAARTDRIKANKTPIRNNFDSIIGLIDPEAIKQAADKYEKDVWEFYRAAFSAIIPLQREEDRLEKELRNLISNSRTTAFSNHSGPFSMTYNSNSLPFGGTNSTDIFTRKRILESQLAAIAYSSYFTEFSLSNSREKIAKKFKYVIGKEKANALINFHVEDPFETAFALFYLLDNDSNIPWLYYGSISVAYTAADQLPFDTANAADGRKTMTSDLNETLYRHKYQGYRWENETDCLGEAIDRERAKNLSQILYSNTYALFPRVAFSLPTFENILENLNVKNDEESDIYRMMLYLLNSQHFRGESLTTYHLRAAEENNDDLEPKKSPTPESLPEDGSRINLLQMENSSLKTALHEESVLRKDAKQKLRRMAIENENNRRELADLRSLLLSLQSQNSVDEETDDITIEFPIRLKKRIVSFGGHPSWLSEMKKMLPDVSFYSPEVTPNTDVLRTAEEVWIQTNCISHASYYRIVNFLAGYQVKIRYFGFSSAQKCAEQLISAHK